MWTTGHSDVVPDQYTVPRIEDSLTSLNGIKWLSVLDLRSGYDQILMSEVDKERTAFCLNSNRCERMPQGMSGAPAILQCVKY